MSYWVWNPACELGIKEIDDQHRQMIEYINDLSYARSSGERESTLKVLSSFMEYTRIHFEFEEALLEEANYPLWRSHKRMHDSFIAKINQSIERINEGKEMSKSLEVELHIWLMNRIQDDDTDYMPLLKKTLRKKRPLADKRNHTKTGWLQKIISKIFAR